MLERGGCRPRKPHARLGLVFGTEASTLPGWSGRVGGLRFRPTESWAGSAISFRIHSGTLPEPGLGHALWSGTSPTRLETHGAQLTGLQSTPSCSLRYGVWGGGPLLCSTALESLDDYVLGSQSESLSPVDGHCSGRERGSGLERSPEFNRKEAPADPRGGSRAAWESDGGGVWS